MLKIGQNGNGSWSRPRPTQGCRAKDDDDPIKRNHVMSQSFSYDILNKTMMSKEAKINLMCPNDFAEMIQGRFYLQIQFQIFTLYISKRKGNKSVCHCFS